MHQITSIKEKKKEMYQKQINRLTPECIDFCA